MFLEKILTGRNYFKTNILEQNIYFGSRNKYDPYIVKLGLDFKVLF